MPKQSLELNNFTGGLFTEASPLAFPPNTCDSIENFTINKDGSVKKRDGLSQVRTTSEGAYHTRAINTRVRKVACRENDRIYITDLGDNVGSSVTTVATGTTTLSLPVAVLDGFAWIEVNEMKYWSAKTSTVQGFPMEVRDVWGVDDGLDGPERPSTLSVLHRYNLYNQGWQHKFLTPGPVTSDITFTKLYTEYGNLSDNGGAGPFFFPGNADLFNDGFDLGLSEWLANQARGAGTYNTEAGRGRFIIDLLSRGASRETIAEDYTDNSINFASLPSDISYIENGSKLGSYAGRMFYWLDNVSDAGTDSRSPSLANYIFYTRVLSSPEDLGKCYSKNDPTDPDVNDILPTDGGFIEIPELDRVVSIKPVGNGLVVVTETQIYFITGPDGVFRADDYSVELISRVDLGVEGTDIYEASVVSSGDGLLIAGSNAIYQVAPNPQSGRLSVTNLTVGRIAKYYKNEMAKTGVVDTHYSQTDRIVRIMARKPAGTPVELILDLDLNAYYVHDHNQMTFVGYAPTSLDTFLYCDTRGPSIRLLETTENSVVDNMYNDTTYADYEFAAHMQTGHALLETSQIDKQIDYLTVHFNRTEDGFTDIGGGNLEADNQSSCLMSTKWNFADTSASGKVTTPQEIYRYVRTYTPADASDPFDWGETVISTKNKVRGQGKAFQLRFEAPAGYQCHILGWGMSVYTGTNA